MGISAAAFLDAVPRAPRARLRQHYGLTTDQTVVLFIGRLVAVKGVDQLIAACTGLSGVIPVIIGDGPERAALEDRARQHHCPALFLGQQLGEAKKAWLQASDMLALPSVILADGRTDSAPVVLLEGMAAGLPVVASRVGGNAELVREGENGLLVPPNDVGQLRAAIAHLAKDPAQRRFLGSKGQETARLYTWDQVGARLRRLLLEL